MIEKQKKFTLASLVLVAAMLVLVIVLDQVIKPTDSMSMLLKVLQKGSIYALAAVSMNLLNGFTGLFSLGHAGFMLIGAYTYAIFTIPSDARDVVYQYYDAAVRLSFPEALSSVLGPFGTLLGVTLAIIAAGLVAALVAYLIGAAAEVRLSGHRHIGLCRGDPGRLPVGQTGASHQRLQSSKELCAY